jgi:hypothetical protein
MIHILDKVLPLAALQALQKEIQFCISSPSLVRYNNTSESKLALDACHIKNDTVLKWYNYLTTVASNTLSRLYRGTEILRDPEGRGCGVHILPCNGFLDLHYDGNWHPKIQKLRFANMVFHVLGDEKEGAFHYKDFIVPFKPGRMIIFTTTENEIHGVPTPVVLPRYTLSTFFYTDGPKPDKVYRATFPYANETFKEQRAAL